MPTLVVIFPVQVNRLRPMARCPPPVCKKHVLFHFNDGLSHYSMKHLYLRLLVLIAGSTRHELAAQIRYLKIENQILRSKLPRIVNVTPQERTKLVKFGAKLGKALTELVTIVHPNTLSRWIRNATKMGRAKVRLRGRPPTREEIRQLILKLARENDWGYTRILGELRKLDIHGVSRTTIRNILRANGFDPGPKRGAGTWDEFLKIHAATLWQCDFFSKRIMTVRGIRHIFVLVFIHVGTRRVFVSPATFHPVESWVKAQAIAFNEHVRSSGLECKIVMHDRDCKFSNFFDEVLAARGREVKKTAYRSPNTNAFVERFIQTMKKECLDHFVVFGKTHMEYLVAEMVTHYHEERPHQSKENMPLLPAKRSKDVGFVDAAPIVCRPRLGGLLKHYYRKVA